MENKKLVLYLSIAGALSGIAAIFSYFNNRKKNQLQAEVAGLDKEIKLLQLSQMKKTA